MAQARCYVRADETRYRYGAGRLSLQVGPRRGDDSRQPGRHGPCPGRRYRHRHGQMFAKSDPSKKVPLGRIVKDSDDLIGLATTHPSFPKEVEGKSYVAHFPEVEVDKWTGHVKITRYVAAHDSGTILNRLTAESQVKDGIVQGIGMALTEELLIDKVTGIPINPNYRDAKVPTHLETPDVEVIFIENYDPYGVFGGKVVG